MSSAAILMRSVSNGGFAYVQGEFVALESARVSLLDRGYLFGDGVYEASAVLDGRLIDNEAHLARLERSLAEIDIAMPMPREELSALQRQLIDRNGFREGLFYIQVTRGVAGVRSFSYAAGLQPTLSMFVVQATVRNDPVVHTGASVISFPDLRWARRDVKSIGLLAQVMAKQEAMRRGAFEALLVDAEGRITEGGSSSFFVVTQGKILARPLSRDILPGITRAAVLRLAAEHGIAVEHQHFTLSEAQHAQEAFLTGATWIALPVVEIDGHPVGAGRPGPLARRLRAIYFEHMGLPGDADTEART